MTQRRSGARVSDRPRAVIYRDEFADLEPTFLNLSHEPRNQVFLDLRETCENRSRRSSAAASHCVWLDKLSKQAEVHRD